MTVVYLDSVFLFNALLDYLLVLSAARLAGLTLRRGRYILCGLLGGAYAAAVFLPGGAFLTAAPVKAAAGVLLALAAFGGERHFWRLTLLTFAIACALGEAFWRWDCWQDRTSPMPGVCSIRMWTAERCWCRRRGCTLC